MTENEIYIQVRNIVKTQKIGSVELVGNNLVFTLEDKSKLYVNTTDNEVKITSIRTNKDGFLFVTLSTGLEFDAGRYSRIASKGIQLTIDSKVTKKSQNPVTSAGVYNYGQNLKQDILDNLPDIDSEKEVIEGHYDFNEGKFYTDEKKTEEVTGVPSKLYISVTTDSEPTVIDKFESYKVKVGEEFLFQVEHQYINLDDKEKIYNTTWDYYTLLQAPQEDAYMVVYEYMRDENRKQVDFAIGVLRTIDDEPCIYIDSGILQNTTWFHRQPYKSIDILPDGSRKDNDSEQTWNRNGVMGDDFDIHSSSDVGELAQVNSEAIYTPNGIVIDRPLNENTGVVARNALITTYEKNYTLYNYDESTKDFKQLGGGSGNLSNYYTKTEIDDKFSEYGTITQEDIDRICV